MLETKMARLALLCIASVLCSSTWAGPVQSSRRSSTSPSQTLTPVGRCSDRDNVFKAGQTYEYRYFGKAETGLGFGQSKTVGLALDCKVRLSVPEPCEFHLKVENCQALEHDGKDASREDAGHPSLEEEVRALEHREAGRRGFQPSERSEELNRQVTKYPIQAQIANGEVARVIYEDEEETWVVNLKKAIIDALQVNIKHADTERRGKLYMENGIHGLCPTKFSSRNDAETVTVEKKLDACIQREKENWQLSPLTPVWNMTMVSLAMKGKIVCVYKLEPSSHVRSMTCRETYQMLPLPWANHTAVATTNITQTLRFVGKQSSAERMDRDLSSKTITSILYEHENATDVNRKPTQGNADGILKDLVEKATEGFDIDAPAVFDDFVDELRDSTDLNDVIAVTRGMRDNKQEVAKYLLVQGLVQCNAPACLRALNTMMEAEEIPRSVFEPVVMALAMSNQQDPLFLEEITRSCEQRPSRTCTLMVGALAYKLVEDDEDVLEEEQTAEPIRRTVDFLTSLIEEGQCQPSSQLQKADEDSDSTKLILALKAIGNLGNVAQKIEEAQPSPRRSRDDTSDDTEGQSTGRSKSQRQMQMRHQDERRPTISRKPQSGSTGTAIVDKIFQCIEGRNVPANVSLTAISALRRFTPTKDISRQLLSVLSNPEKKSEVRMAACMASMRMATDRSDVQKIVHIMQSERDDQLQAFMTSHIKSVLMSEDPHYKEIAKMLKETVGHRGENLPKIKARIPHSVHLELSKFYQVPLMDKEDSEFGAQIEGSLIFTTKSYMPEGMHLNISTQLFGDYVNLLEAGASMSGVENLVEKVLGPEGVLSRSKMVRRATEAVKMMMRMAEEMGYKHLKLESIQKFTGQAMQMMRSRGYEDIMDRLLSAFEVVDTSALSAIVGHMRSMDADKVMDAIRQAIPQSAQLTKVVDRLKRIRLSDATPETLVEVLEACGISASKSREILRQAKSYGVDLDRASEYLRELDMEEIENKLNSLSTGDIKDKVMFVVRKVQQVLQWMAETYDLPSLRTITNSMQKTFKGAFNMETDGDSSDNDSFPTRKSKHSGQRRKSSLFGSWGEDDDEDYDNEDEEDNKEDDERSNRRNSAQDRKQPSQMQDKRSKTNQRNKSNRKNDYEVLDQMSWGQHVKSYKRNSDDEDRDGVNDDEDIDIVAFVRVLGNELGFITLDDVTDLLDMDKMMETLKVRGGWSGLFKDVLDGFDIQPTMATKMEGLHHISTGLGLPLQITMNMTTIATVHIKVQPEGSSLRTSRVEFEPSGAFQFVGGMAVDLPSITKIAVVSNTTAKSEMELKLRFDLQADNFELHFEKPDEELDIIHFKHEVKLVKDDEDFEPFPTGKSNQVRSQKCLPHIVERVTGLKICSHVETSTMQNSLLLSHGPHELRITAKESDSTGLEHVKMSGRRQQEERENRFEFKVGAPGKHSQREGRALLKHDRQRNHVTAGFDMTEDNTPSAHFFWRNLAEEDSEIRYGVETGFDVSTEQDQHYNASLTVLVKYDGYSSSIKDMSFNYTLAASLQAPQSFVNISTTTAKIRETIMMEHNLTYAIPEDSRMPLFNVLRFRGASERDDISKFTLRHGVFLRNDRTAVDARVFVKLLTFPHLDVAEPTIYHICQIKVYRDLGHIGLHSNTTWLNAHHELEFFNASTTMNNIMDLKNMMRPGSMRGMSMAMNVSRNDWFVALETEVEKQSDAVVMSHEVTASGHMPECRSMIDCAVKSVTADLKRVAGAFKPTSVSGIANIPRHPHHHMLRKAGQAHDSSPSSRHQELKVNIENVIREKSSTSRDNGFWNQRTSRSGQKVFEVKTRASITSSNGRNNDMTATTVFGNDASERGAILSLFMVNNATATNIPYESNNFVHLLINKEDGLVMTMNMSIDNDNRELMGMDGLLQIDPKDMEARATLSINTPFLDGEGQAEMKMPAKGRMETRMSSKTEADSQTYDFLAHKMESHMKVSPTEMTQTIRFKHKKLQSDFELRMNLHGQSESASARLELDEDDEQDETSMERSKQRRSQTGSSSRQDQRQSGRHTERDAEGQQRSTDDSQRSHRQRSPRSISRNDGEERNDHASYERHQGRQDPEGRDEYGQNRDEMRTSRNPHRPQTTDRPDESADVGSPSREQQSSRRQNKGKPELSGSLLSWLIGKDSDNEVERKAEERDDDGSSSGLSGWWNKVTDGQQSTKNSRYSTKSLRQYASSINPTATFILQIKSLDLDVLPSINIDAKLSMRHSKIDLEVTEVPRKLQHVLSTKRVTLTSTMDNQKAKVEVRVAGRGEAVAEIALRGQREAHAKLYDRGLTSSGEMTHAEITLELPSESTIRAKMFVNPESLPKIERATRHTLKAINEALTTLYRENVEAVMDKVQRVLSDSRHPFYDFIRPFVSGSVEDWSNDMARSIKSMYAGGHRGFRNMYEDTSMLGTSLMELQKKAMHTAQRLWRTVKDLIQDTPAGAWVEAMPSYEEVMRPFERTLNKNFATQMRIIQSKKACMMLETCEVFPAIRATGEVVVEVSRSLSSVDAQQLVRRVMLTIKELLLNTIEVAKVQAHKTDVVRMALQTIDIDAVEDFIRSVEVPRMETLTQMAKAVPGMTTALASRKFDKFMTIDSRGALVLTIPHPFRWINFKELPRLSEEHQGRARNFLEKSRINLRDLVDDDDVHIPMSGRKEGLRFKWSTLKQFPKKTLGTQTAMIFGDRHVMTFDGTVYSVPQSGSQCTYLMARGTRRENFALVKSHDGITLTLPEMAVTITKDNFVRLNNSRSNVALPVESANKKTTVKLVGDSIEVESKSGIKLSCASDKKICTVEVSMGMWGESSGLLGSNDNEADNDWQMSSGKKADNVHDFLNSYEVSKNAQCQLTNSQPNSSRREGRPGKESTQCRQLFSDDNSQLSPCFETVDAEEFMKACEQETEETDERTAEEITCAVVGAYREICSIKGVNTEEPKECETCQGHKQNSQWQVRGNGRKVDVVVVVSEHQDIAKEFASPADKINSIVNTITRKLQQYNGQDVRTALVGFSGSGVHKNGHTHTTQNDQFLSVDQLTSAMRTLKFKGREQTDALEAVDFVVESHDFRPEATKIILVFGPEERQFTGGNKMESVQDKLRKHGIAVTVFAKYDNGSMKDSDIGMNYDGSLFKESPSSSSSSHEGQQSKSKDVQGGRMPSQQMSRMAKASRGAVFRLENIMGSGRSSQALERVSETIVQQVQREEQSCKVCQCQETQELRQLTAACMVVAC